MNVRAGVKIKTNFAVHHDRLDIVICLTNPNEVFVLEIAISHLQNIREKILGRMYKAPVKFGVLVLGALGKILRIEDHVESLTILNHLGVHRVQWLLKKCSVSKCESTAKILINRLN